MKNANTFVSLDNRSILKKNADFLVQSGKGILAADEDPSALTHRFQTIGIENTSEQRRIYRQILFTTSQIEKFLSGVLMHEETFEQTTDSSQEFPFMLNELGILVGIKLDRGSQSLTTGSNETITLAFDDLDQRADYFSKRGAHFASWRCVFRLDEECKEPSNAAIFGNLSQLARFASICQSKGLVPLLEIDWISVHHYELSICQRLTEKLLSATFETLRNYDIHLEGCVLKSKMIRTGYESRKNIKSTDIALSTLTALNRTCPTALAGIVFLSSGQTEDEARVNLNAIIEKLDDIRRPWPLTFAFGRALHGSAMKIWMGKRDNESDAQEHFRRCLASTFNKRHEAKEIIDNEKKLFSLVSP